MEEAITYEIAEMCLTPLHGKGISPHLKQQVADKIVAALMQSYKNGIVEGKVQKIRQD